MQRSDFSHSGFLQCLDSNSDMSAYLQQVENLDIEYIHEMVRYCHNILQEPSQQPGTKMAALDLVARMLMTCQVPCIDLIEIYVLPFVYGIAIERPKDHGRRGSELFGGLARGRGNPYAQTGVRFVRLCEELVYVGSVVKPYRNFQKKELGQKSQFAQCLQRYRDYQIPGAPDSPGSLKYFPADFLHNARAQYLKNVQSFYKRSMDYCEFYVTKIIESLESPDNPLFSNSQPASPLDAELDMRRLLMSGDTYITSALIDELVLKVKMSNNLSVKRNCIALLGDMVKWGDIEAMVKICGGRALDAVARRVAEVDGSRGIAEGENLYPEIKGQAEVKRKLYIEFLKFVELFAKCIQICGVKMDGSEETVQLYSYFKKQRRFQFPQNLIAKKIQAQFLENLKQNQERNLQLVSRLQHPNQANHGKPDRQVEAAGLQKMSKQIEDCYMEIMTPASDERQLQQKMKRVRHFRASFNNFIQNYNSEVVVNQNQFEQLVEDGIEVQSYIGRLEALYTKLQNKQIDFKQFWVEHNKLAANSQVNPSERATVNRQSAGFILQAETSIVQHKNTSNLQQNSVTEPFNILKNSHRPPNAQPEPQFILDQPSAKASPLIIEQYLVEQNTGGKFAGRISNRSQLPIQKSMERPYLGQPQLLHKSSGSSFGLKNTNRKSNTVGEHANRVQIGDYQNGQSNLRESNIFRNTKESQRQGQFQVAASQQHHREGSQQNSARLTQRSHNSRISGTASLVSGSSGKGIHGKPSSFATEQVPMITKFQGPKSRQKLTLVSPRKPNHAAKRQASKLSSPSEANPTKSPPSIYKLQGPGYYTGAHESSRQSNKQNPSKFAATNPYNQRQSGVANPTTSSFKLTNNSPYSQKDQVITSMDVRPRPTQAPLRSATREKWQPAVVRETEQSLIREPDQKPLQNSYYDVKEIESQVKNLPRPQFKNCFKLDKQLLPARRQLLNLESEYGILGRPAKLHSPRTHDSRLTERLRKDTENRKLESRIVELKNKKTQLLTEVQDRINRNGSLSNSRSNSASSSISNYVSFSETRSQNSSPLSAQLSERSRQPSFIVEPGPEGRLINQALFKGYFGEQMDDKIRKACLRNKCLLLQNEDVEIGTLFKKTGEYIQLAVYVTSKVDIDDVNYYISKEHNMQISSYWKGSRHVKADKQFKIQLTAQLRNIPYTCPLLTLGYSKSGHLRTVCMQLPLPLFKFVQFTPVDPLQTQQLMKLHNARLVKTPQIILKTSIAKANHLAEYFHTLSDPVVDKSGWSRYGCRAKFNQQQFVLLFWAKGKQRMVVQGLAQHQGMTLQYLLYSIQRTMQN